MAATTRAGGSQINSESVAHPLAPDAPTSKHPGLLAWLAEARRLFAEAEDRIGAGQVLPALSSLAAVPPLHRMVVSRCSELLDAGDAQAEENVPSGGMYL